MGCCSCSFSGHHHKLPQSDISDDTATSGEENDELYELKDEERKEYGDKVWSPPPSKHFLFKQNDFMSWYTDDVSLRHSIDFLNTLKSRYLECDKDKRIGNNRYFEIDAQRGHCISAISPYFKKSITIFECSKRFRDALNQRFPANKYKSNNVRVIEGKLFDHFEPKQDLMPYEFSDGFNLIILHHILNVVNLKKWDILLSYMLEILSNDNNGSLLIISSSSSKGTLMKIINEYIPNFRTSQYILEYFTNLIAEKEWKDSNIIIDSWQNVTKLVYTETMAIKIYLEILETCFNIYDDKLFDNVKIEIQNTLKSNLKRDGFYSDTKDDKTGEYMVTVQFHDVHIAVLKKN